MKATKIEEAVLEILKSLAKEDTTGCVKCPLRHLCTFYFAECPLYWDFDGEVDIEQED